MSIRYKLKIVVENVYYYIEKDFGNFGIGKSRWSEVVESIFQSGKESQTFFGSGRLNAIAAELDVENSAHPWHGVDLILID